MRLLPVIMVASFIDPLQPLQWIGPCVVLFIVFVPHGYRLLGLVAGGVALILAAVFSQMDLSFGLGLSFCLLVAKGWEGPWERKLIWISIPYFSLLFFAPMDTRLFAGVYCLIGGYALFRLSHPQRRILYLAILAPVAIFLLMPISKIPIHSWITGRIAEEGITEESEPRVLVVEVGGHLAGAHDDTEMAFVMGETDETDPESLALPAQILEVLFNILLFLVLITLLRIIWMALVSRSKVFRVWWVVLLCFAGGLFFINLWLSNYRPEPMAYHLPGTMSEGGAYDIEYVRAPTPEEVNGEKREPAAQPSLHTLRMTLLWGLVVALIVGMAGWVWLIARKVPKEAQTKVLSETPQVGTASSNDLFDGLHGNDLVRVVYRQIRKRVFTGSDPLTPNELLAQSEQKDLEVITKAFSKVEYENRQSELNDSTVMTLFQKILRNRSQPSQS